MIPDFDNPIGTVLSRTTREQLVTFCAEKQIVILEDNPYGMFRFEGDSLPTLFSLDRNGCVIYLGTFSKTLCPALRIGFIVLPKHLFGETQNIRSLLEQLSRLKSFITVNTSQIMQAVVGGVLLNHNGSLARIIEPALRFYQNNRNVMLESLQLQFHGYEEQVS